MLLHDLILVELVMLIEKVGRIFFFTSVEKLEASSTHTYAYRHSNSVIGLNIGGGGTGVDILTVNNIKLVIESSFACSCRVWGKVWVFSGISFTNIHYSSCSSHGGW